MKTIIVSLLFLFAVLGSIGAQKKPGKAVPKTTTKVMEKKVDKSTKTTETKDDKTNTTGMKKDGTPDMRLKENKDAKKPVTTGPVKKDGSADMRYKANKPVPKKK